MTTPLTIGSKVWWRDINHRVYEKGQSGPTERGYWRETKIVGESPRMWLLSGLAGKIPKNGKVPEGLATSEEQLERTIWTLENVWRVAEAVKQLRYGVVKDSDAVFQKLAAVAEILGFEPAPPAACGKTESAS